MFLEISKNLLGKYGEILLDFYLSHQLPINLIVVLYGILLVLAHRNLEKLSEVVLEKIGRNQFQNDSPEVLLARQSREFWNEIKKSTGFPFINRSHSFLIHRVSAGNLQKLIETSLQRKINTHVRKAK